MAVDESVRHFYRVAAQRYEDARSLFEQGRFLAATYLAGYAFECGLKALLLSETPVDRRDHLIHDQFRGAQGHSLDFLLNRVAINGKRVEVKRRIPSAHIRRITIAEAVWSVNLRYRAGTGDAVEAAELVTDADQFLSWVKEHI